MAHPEFCPTLNPSTGVCVPVAVIGYACCNKNKHTGRALVSSKDLSVLIAGPLDTHPQLWLCTRVSDKSCLAQIGYPMVCLALTKYPGLGSLVLASGLLPLSWHSLSSNSHMQDLSLWLLWLLPLPLLPGQNPGLFKIRTLIRLQLFPPITYLKCRPSWEFVACSLSCLIHTASMGYLHYSSQYLPTIPLPHFTTAKNHINSTYGTSSRSKSPCHLWGATWSCSSAWQTSAHWFWLGTNYKACLTTEWQEDSVVWWNEHDMSMGIPSRSGFKSLFLHLHKFLNSSRTQKDCWKDYIR